MTKIKEFLKRHGFLVVIIVALIIAAGNYVISVEKNKKDNELIEVPVAVTTLAENTLITSEKLATVTVSKSYLPVNVITDKDSIISKYVGKDCTIPANGFFYNELISDEKSAFGAAYSNLEDGQTAYTISLDDDSEQYGRTNLLKTGEYINIYYFEDYNNEDGNKSYLTGLLAENIKIIDVIENDSKQDFIIIAINEEQISDFILAEQYGHLVPLVNSQSNGINLKKSSFYDADSLRYYLKNKSTVLTQATDIEKQEDPANVDQNQNATNETEQGE